MFWGDKDLFLVQEIFHVVVVYHFFLEHVSTCFWRFYHFNHLGERFTGTSLQGRNYFLSHDKMLFNFFVNGYALQNRIVFLQLDALRSVFLVFCGDVTACARNTTVLVLCAL